MSVVNITATIECDECGTQFTVALDESYVPPPGWAVFDIAVDAIRGTLWESVENERHLCRTCTHKADLRASAEGER